ncbi:hypothetical protein J4219_02000 [Candidatus Woesearchaeota archaeon]|nr:hypothetical protein [Candidatus Woesearchaeota archaeon]
MEEEQRGVALVILGIIAVIAVIGLVLMFSGAKKSAGAVPTLLGSDLPSGFCDSPCTFAFGASQSEVAMQTQRFMARGFTPVGQTQWTYAADGFGLYGQCLCPPMNTPFANTPEYEQIVYGTPLSGRTPGTPSPMYVETPAPTVGQMPIVDGAVPGYPYPASLNK